MISMEGWREVTGGLALLCCPQGDRDIKSFLLSLYGRLCASAWAPFRPQNSLRDPGSLDTVPWRWGSSDMG